MCLYYPQKSDHAVLPPQKSDHATQKLVVNGSMFLLFQGEHFGRFQAVSFQGSTLQETNISPKNGILKMIFLFPRWDMSPGGYLFF